MSDRIIPIYGTHEINISIELGTYPVSHWSGGKKATEGVNFTMRFVPRLRLVGESPQFMCIDPNTYVEIASPFSRFQPVGYGLRSTLSPRSEPVDIRYSQTPKMREIIFHVINFYDFMEVREDLVVRDEFYHGRLSKITLQGGGWHVVVQALPSTTKLIDDLCREGGYAITHVGKIARRRGGAFSANNAKRILEVLRLFFSFARGTFSGVVLPLGFDESGQRQWGQWGAQHIIYPWRYYEGWFQGQPASLLEDLFPGFFQLCRDPIWQRPLRESMYLYFESKQHERSWC